MPRYTYDDLIPEIREHIEETHRITVELYLLASALERHKPDRYRSDARILALREAISGIEAMHGAWCAEAIAALRCGTVQDG